MANILFENGLKSIARVLTSCFDCEVHFSPKARTASITKTKAGNFLITLPSIEAVKVSNRDKRIINGYADHEIFHGNWTDLEWASRFSKKNPNLAKIVSLLDEGRIETLGGKKFIGSISNLKAMNDFITDGMLDKYEPDGGKGDLLTGLIWYSIGHSYFDKLSSKIGHVKPMLDMVADLIEPTRHVETIQEIKPYAEEIVKRWHQQEKEEEKNENENKDEQKEDNKDESEDMSGGGDSGDGEEEHEDGTEQDNAPRVKGSGENEEGEGEEEEIDGGDTEEESQGGKGKGEEDDEGEEEELSPEEMAEELFGGDADDSDSGVENFGRVIIEELIEQLIAEDTGESYRPVREYDVVKDYKGNDKRFLKELDRETNRFQALKTQLHRCITIQGQDHWNRNLRSGKIDYKSLYRLTEMIDTDIWKEHQKGQVFDTAITIMIDGSGSMSSYWEAVRDLVKNIANMLKGKADLEILIQDTNGRCREDSLSSEEVFKRYGKGYNRYQPCVVRVIKGFGDPLECLSSIDNFTTKDNAVENEALRVAVNRILQRPNKRKIIFSVTDGYPRSDYEHDDTSALLRDLKDVIDEVIAKTDIELIALGIGKEGSTAVKEYYPDWVEVDSVQALAKTGMRKLAKILKKGLRGKSRKVA